MNSAVDIQKYIFSYQGRNKLELMALVENTPKQHMDMDIICKDIHISKKLCTFYLYGALKAKVF